MLSFDVKKIRVPKIFYCVFNCAYTTTFLKKQEVRAFTTATGKANNAEPKQTAP